MPHPLAPTLEQESLRALRSLVIDVYERGDADTARRLPIIAYRIANSASRRKSERLLQNALDIWIMDSRCCRVQTRTPFNGRLLI